jgi:hypothetical protein
MLENSQILHLKGDLSFMKVKFTPVETMSDAFDRNSHFNSGFWSVQLLVFGGINL